MLKRVPLVVALLVLLGLALVGEAIIGASQAEKGYEVVLINNFMGNVWRPIMERSAQLLKDVPPLKGKIKNLRIINTENSAAAENAALNSVIASKPKPDIILLIAASPTALNQTIQAAMDAGIVVISFDVLVEGIDVWKIAPDFYYMGRGQAQWMMNAIGGKGTIFMDLGQPGAKSSKDWVEGARSVLKDYPDVKIYTYYAQFSPGEEQAQVATLIAAHPKVDGILGFAYGNYALAALQQAGHPPVPVTGFAYSEALLDIVFKYNNVPALYYSSPAWVSGEAMRLGVEVLEGKRTGKPTYVRLATPWFTNNSIPFPNPEGDPVYQIKDYATPDLPPGVILPLSPPWAELDIKEVMKPPILK